jgi:CRP-like cAMP-binding protein
MALLDGTPRSATVTAQTNLSVLVLTPDTLDELLALPSVAHAVIATMAARLRAIEGTPQHA